MGHSTIQGLEQGQQMNNNQPPSDMIHYKNFYFHVPSPNINLPTKYSTMWKSIQSSQTGHRLHSQQTQLQWARDGQTYTDSKTSRRITALVRTSYTFPSESVGTARPVPLLYTENIWLWHLTMNMRQKISISASVSRYLHQEQLNNFFFLTPFVTKHHIFRWAKV